MASIKDVAREAGVSVATVSRVINKKGVCIPATEKAVLDAIKKLGYKPNLFGKALRSSETNIIMIMLSSLASTFCNSVIREIDKIAERNGYHTIVCATDGISEKEDYYTSFACNGLFDGMIVLNSSFSKEKMSEISATIPVVQCNEYIDTGITPYVTINNRKAAYDATKLLIDNGNKKIVLFSVDNKFISTKERFSGYKQALSDNGIEFDKDLIIYGDHGYRSAVEVFEEFLKTGKEFDSVFAISDRMAAGALTVLSSKGISVPEEIEIIGFDNTDISYISTPKLTTVSQPCFQLGQSAFEQLKLLIDGEKAKNVVLDYEIILRESTKR